MAVQQVSGSEKEPVEPESRVRAALKKHTDTLVAVGISALIFSSAYFLRIAPQLKNIDGQMTGLSTQLSAVNEGLMRIETHDLFALQNTSRDLQRRMASVVTNTTELSGRLGEAGVAAGQVRADLQALHESIVAYQAAVSAAAAPYAQPLPDVRGAADRLARQLDEAQTALAPNAKPFPGLYAQAVALQARLDEGERALPAKRKFPGLLVQAEALEKKIAAAEAKVGTKAKPFPDLAAAARDLQEEMTRLRKSLKRSMVACSDLDKASLKRVQRAGHCPK